MLHRGRSLASLPSASRRCSYRPDFPGITGCWSGVEGRVNVIRFGVFEAHLSSGELFKSGKRVRLQQQPFDVLRTLITRPGEVVTRDDLRKALWPDDVTVDFDQSLNKSVTKLRDALGDLAASPRFIETLPKRGYRFIADVHSAESADPTVAAEPEQRPVNHRLRWIPGGVWLSATAAAAMVVTIAALAITATRNSAKPLEAGAEKSRGVDSAATHTPIFAARDAYDLGRAALTRRSEESLKLSLQHFTRAVALSPRFAAAHVGTGRKLGAPGQLWRDRSARGHAACARRGQSRATPRPQLRPRPCLARANRDDLRLGLAHRRLAFHTRDRPRARRRDDPSMVRLLLQRDRSPSGCDRRGSPSDRGRAALALGEYRARLRPVPGAALRRGGHAAHADAHNRSRLRAGSPRSRPRAPSAWTRLGSDRRAPARRRAQRGIRRRPRPSSPTATRSLATTRRPDGCSPISNANGRRDTFRPTGWRWCMARLARSMKPSAGCNGR